MRRMSADVFRVTERAGTLGSVHILSVTGPITSSTSPAFLDAAKAVTAPCLILDLAEVPSIDSMAVGTLVQVFISCHKSGRKLALAGLTHRVRNVLHLTGIAPLFETYASVAEAERSLT
jgi:anti-anti-sigma factor